jgi:DNA-binding response OmpR family regulator
MSVIEDVKTILGKAPPPQPAAKEPPKKILIVEDDPILLEMYKDKFLNEEFAVITATNGKEGLDIAVDQKPNIILLDLMMPIMSGQQMLKRLRELPQFKRLPVIVLTNAGEIDNIRQTKRYDDACDFLIKSNVSIEDVVAKVKFWLHAFLTD